MTEDIECHCLVHNNVPPQELKGGGGGGAISVYWWNLYLVPVAASNLIFHVCRMAR